MQKYPLKSFVYKSFINTIYKQLILFISYSKNSPFI